MSWWIANHQVKRVWRERKESGGEEKEVWEREE